MNRVYDAEGRAFRIEEVAGGFQLMSRPKFAPWLARLHSAPVAIRLSGSAMETLAVVAYRQPVLRADIDAIRGVQSGEVLRQLIERDLVRIIGRSDELGRPYLYGTTKYFLQIFGLRHLDELPRAEVFRAGEPATATGHEPSTQSKTETQNQSNQSQVVEEENNVKTLITVKSRRECLAEDRRTIVMEPSFGDLSSDPAPIARYEDEDDDLDDDEDDDVDDEDDEDLDEDEPWEEVEDDDEDLDEDEDEDWDDDEDDEDDDEDEDDEKEEDKGKKK